MIEQEENEVGTGYLEKLKCIVTSAYGSMLWTRACAGQGCQTYKNSLCRVSDQSVNQNDSDWIESKLLNII